jgi:hypothetical protein
MNPNQDEERAQSWDRNDNNGHHELGTSREAPPSIVAIAEATVRTRTESTAATPAKDNDAAIEKSNHFNRYS